MSTKSERDCGADRSIPPKSPGESIDSRFRLLLFVALLGLTGLSWYCVGWQEDKVGLQAWSSRDARPGPAASSHAGTDTGGGLVRLPASDTGERKVVGVPDDPSLDSGETEPLDWLQVRPLFVSDFDLTDEDKAEFLKSMLTLNEDVSFKGEIVELRIEFPDWDEEKRRDLVTGLGLSTARYEELSSDIEQLWTQYLDILEPQSQSALDLLGESMKECWRNDMYVRKRVGESLVPDGFWDRRGGVYNTQFASEARGWKILVPFDSEDFPMLDLTLVEIESMKAEFASSLLALLAE